MCSSDLVSTDSLAFSSGDLELPSPLPQSRSLQWQAHSLIDGSVMAGLPFELVHDDQLVAQGLTDGSGQSTRHQQEQDYSEYEVWLGESGWTVSVDDLGQEPPAPLDDQIATDDELGGYGEEPAE